MGGVLRRLLPLIAVVFGLGIGLATLDVAEAATPKLIQFTAPKPTQGSPVTISWRLRDIQGAETWVAWDTRSSSSGAPRNQSRHLTGQKAIETFTDTIQVPSNATTLYFTVTVRVDGSTLQFSERRFTVTKRIAAATSVEDAENAMALVLIEDEFGLAGSGSAFVVDEDTLITNYHVIDGAEAITVVFDDGTEAPGTVVGFDIVHDLAAIRADTPTTAKRLEWNNTKREPIRTSVWAWGYPGSTVASFGTTVAPTLTDGIISQYQARDDLTYIQTTADVHPGNSGGPLVTASGRVVGVVRANLVNPITGASESGLNLAISVADHTAEIAAVIGGAKETGEKFAPAGATLSGMGFVAYYADADGRWCGSAGSSPDNYAGIVGLCLEAQFPATLAGVTIQLVWRQDGVVVCDRTSVVSDEWQSGELLPVCRPAVMRTGTYSVTVTSGARTLGTFSRQVTVSGRAAAAAFIDVLIEDWEDTNATLDLHTTLWNAFIDIETLPSTRLQTIANAQVQASRDMLAALERLRSHPGYSEPVLSQLHANAVAFWNARVTYHNSLSQYAAGAVQWPVVENNWTQLEQAFVPFETTYCNALPMYNLGSC